MADYILKSILLKFGQFDRRDGLVMDEDEALYFFKQVGGRRPLPCGLVIAGRWHVDRPALAQSWRGAVGQGGVACWSDGARTLAPLLSRTQPTLTTSPS